MDTGRDHGPASVIDWHAKISAGNEVQIAELASRLERETALRSEMRAAYATYEARVKSVWPHGGVVSYEDFLIGRMVTLENPPSIRTYYDVDEAVRATLEGSIEKRDQYKTALERLLGVELSYETCSTCTGAGCSVCYGSGFATALTGNRR